MSKARMGKCLVINGRIVHHCLHSVADDVVGSSRAKRKRVWQSEAKSKSWISTSYALQKRVGRSNSLSMLVLILRFRDAAVTMTTEAAAVQRRDGSSLEVRGALA